jgi:hypothetical protein
LPQPEVARALLQQLHASLAARALPGWTG